MEQYKRKREVKKKKEKKGRGDGSTKGRQKKKSSGKNRQIDGLMRYKVVDATLEDTTDADSPPAMKGPPWVPKKWSTSFSD